MGRFFILTLLLSGLAFLSATVRTCCGGESATPKLQPSFPNHAMLLVPSPAQPRGSPAGPLDTELPFSWTQTVVLREGVSSLRLIGGFDPNLQPVQYELLPYEPVNVNVDSAIGSTGFMQVTARAHTGGLKEIFPFRVQARDLTSVDIFNLIYDIRLTNTRIRGTPTARRSVGDFVKPGQIVRYAWTQTGSGEKRPKVEAEFFGRTGIAKGLYSSTITEVLAVKAQPFVLGHYLMTITPRDVRGEPPRGSTSNGLVIQCSFGSDNLPPVTDGLTADSFLPDVGQSITLSPVAFDPETGQSVFSNELWDFGDGTVLTGITGAATHAYAQPGIYRVRCTVADDHGLTATAEDNIIVGATVLPQMTFTFVKNIPPDEAGTGLINEDKLNAQFPGAGAKIGDRIVFAYNRNRFGRVSASDGSDADIVLKPGGFTGSSGLTKNITVTGGKSVSIDISKAAFDRTGDPRFGRPEFKGVFKHQRIAVCVIPADGTTPRAYVYTGNMQIKVKAGPVERTGFVPEDSIHGTATTKEPNPKRQEIY